MLLDHLEGEPHLNRSTAPAATRTGPAFLSTGTAKVSTQPVEPSQPHTAVPFFSSLLRPPHKTSGVLSPGAAGGRKDGKSPCRATGTSLPCPCCPPSALPHHPPHLLEGLPLSCRGDSR